MILFQVSGTLTLPEAIEISRAARIVITGRGVKTQIGVQFSQDQKQFVVINPNRQHFTTQQPYVLVFGITEAFSAALDMLGLSFKLSCEDLEKDLETVLNMAVYIVN